MPLYNHTPPYQIYWCHICGAWFIHGEHHLHCGRHHKPGTCCHQGEQQVTITPVTIVREENRTPLCPRCGGHPVWCHLPPDPGEGNDDHPPIVEWKCRNDHRWVTGVKS